jgi:hypothetical protein
MALKEYEVSAQERVERADVGLFVLTIVFIVAAIVVTAVWWAADAGTMTTLKRQQHNQRYIGIGLSLTLGMGLLIWVTALVRTIAQRAVTRGE